MDYSQFLYMHEEMSLLGVILLLFVTDLLFCKDSKRGGIYNTPLPVILLGVMTVFNALPLTDVQFEAFGGMYQHTPMDTIVKTTLNVGTLITFLMAHKWLARPENLVKQGEFYVVTLFTLLGMYFMISSGHFLMFFIGLELASIPMVALVSFDKYRYESAEAGAKYILLALFSSALLLYGVSLIYAATGSLYFNQIGVANTPSLLLLCGLAMFLAGMGFKISLVPFHLWTADTYEGAPTAVTAYLSVVSKGSAAFVLLVVLAKAFTIGSIKMDWEIAFFWIIIASITLANLFAIRQSNLKRFMAYSAISQAGYLVLGIMGGTELANDGTAQGMTAMVYYLLVYLAANMGAFAVINVVEQNSGKLGIKDYNGLYQTNPRLAFLMTLCLFSLAGIPPFAGFFSKFFIFMAAFNAGFKVLVFIALVNTIISLYYYLLIVKAMYISESDKPIATFRSDGYTRVALALCTAGVLLLGIAGWVYNYLTEIGVQSL